VGPWSRKLNKGCPWPEWILETLSLEHDFKLIWWPLYSQSCQHFPRPIPCSPTEPQKCHMSHQWKLVKWYVVWNISPWIHRISASLKMCVKAKTLSGTRQITSRGAARQYTSQAYTAKSWKWAENELKKTWKRAGKELENIWFNQRDLQQMFVFSDWKKECLFLWSIDFSASGIGDQTSKKSLNCRLEPSVTEYWCLLKFKYPFPNSFKDHD